MTCSLGRAVGGVEVLPLPEGVVVGLGRGHPGGGGHGSFGLQEQVDRAVDGDLEGILGDGRLVAAGGRWPLGEADGLASVAGGGPGDAHGQRGHLVGGGTVHAAGAGETPCAVHQDADAEALRLAQAEGVHEAGLDAGVLLAPPDDAHVGVAGAEMGGRVERATRQVMHGPPQGSKAAAGEAHASGSGPGSAGCGPYGSGRSAPRDASQPSSKALEALARGGHEGLVEGETVGERGDERHERVLAVALDEVIDGGDALRVGQAEAAGACRELPGQALQRDEAAGAGRRPPPGRGRRRRSPWRGTRRGPR